MACSLTNVLSFGELEDFIEIERQPYYLDGPRQVDWILPNAINASREGSMYVDYVRDLTVSKGDSYWNCQTNSEFDFGRYLRPESAQLCRTICDAGLDAEEGLAILAWIWRKFEPERDTGRDKLKGLFAETLLQLENTGLCKIDESHSSFIFSCWSFPLWPLELDQIDRIEKPLDDLRNPRRLAIKRIEEIEAKREPELTIERAKVEALSKTYFDWQRAIEELEAGEESGSDKGLKFRLMSDFDRHYELPSYKNLQQMYDALNGAERTDLVALAWYKRFSISDWPGSFEQAKERIKHLDTSYQIGLGNMWLAGLDRWEEVPKSFRPGIIRSR